MIERPAVDALSPSSEMRRGVLPTMLGWLGVAAGFLAASTMLPDGCAIHEDEAERLRWSLPWMETIVFVLLGWFLARRLSSKKTFLVVAAAGTVVASLIASAVISLVYKGGLTDTPLAFGRFLCLYLGLLGAVIFVAVEARRPGSGVTRTRRVIAATAASIAPIEILFWGGARNPVIVPLAMATWALSLFSCAVLLALALAAERDIAALLRARHEGAAPYRALPPEVEDARLAAHRSARRFAWGLLALAVPGSAVAFLVAWTLPPPAPPAPDSIGFSVWRGC